MNDIKTNQGYHLQKTGSRVNTLLERHFIVPTLSTPPQLDTASWQDGEYIVEFRIGELCRVKQDNKWSFFRLQDITNDGHIWVNANAADIPDMGDYYTREETDDAIDTRIASIVIPEDESIKTLSISEYDALVEEGKISDKTLYMVTSEGSPIAVYVGSVLIAQRDEGSQGFAYNFPIIF